MNLYRSIPVHPANRPLLWQGMVDGHLAFSRPRSSSQLWQMDCYGASSKEASSWQSTIWIPGAARRIKVHSVNSESPPAVCEELGAPVALEKTKGPVTSLTFLGIKINTQAEQLCLPREKLADLRDSIQSWMQHNKPCTPKNLGTKRDSLSLIGKLHHASRVIKLGRAFIHSLIDTSMTAKAPRLTQGRRQSQHMLSGGRLLQSRMG